MSKKTLAFSFSSVVSRGIAIVSFLLSLNTSLLSLEYSLDLSGGINWSNASLEIGSLRDVREQGSQVNVINIRPETINKEGLFLSTFGLHSDILLHRNLNSNFSF